VTASATFRSPGIRWGRGRRGLRTGAAEATLHRQPGVLAPCRAGPAFGDARAPGLCGSNAGSEPLAGVARCSRSARCGSPSPGCRETWTLSKAAPGARAATVSSSRRSRCGRTSRTVSPASSAPASSRPIVVQGRRLPQRTASSEMVEDERVVGIVARACGHASIGRMLLGESGRAPRHPTGPIAAIPSSPTRSRRSWRSRRSHSGIAIVRRHQAPPLLSRDTNGGVGASERSWLWGKAAVDGTRLPAPNRRQKHARATPHTSGRSKGAPRTRTRCSVSPGGYRCADWIARDRDCPGKHARFRCPEPACR
jgi:hypothetical protein